jgi:hypothetical protein
MIIESLKSLHTLIYNKERTGSRAIQSNDFENMPDDKEPWFSDDQEEVYGDQGLLTVTSLISMILLVFFVSHYC